MLPTPSTWSDKRVMSHLHEQIRWRKHWKNDKNKRYWSQVSSNRWPYSYSRSILCDHFKAFSIWQKLSVVFLDFLTAFFIFTVPWQDISSSGECKEEGESSWWSCTHSCIGRSRLTSFFQVATHSHERAYWKQLHTEPRTLCSPRKRED